LVALLLLLIGSRQRARRFISGAPTRVVSPITPFIDDDGVIPPVIPTIPDIPSLPDLPDLPDIDIPSIVAPIPTAIIRAVPDIPLPSLPGVLDVTMPFIAGVRDIREEIEDIQLPTTVSEALPFLIDPILDPLAEIGMLAERTGVLQPFEVIGEAAHRTGLLDPFIRFGRGAAEFLGLTPRDPSPGTIPLPMFPVLREEEFN
jgi:hypothetical protein